MNGLKKHKAAIIISAVILIAAIVAAAVIPSALRRAEISNQFEIAQQYLNDLDYEGALLAFTRILEIDPKNVEARKGLFEAYHGLIHQYLDAFDIRAQQLWTDMKAALSLSEDAFMVTETHAEHCGENDTKTVHCVHCGEQWHFMSGSDYVSVLVPIDETASQNRHIINGSNKTEKACGVIVITCECGEIIQGKTGEHLWDDGVLTIPPTFEKDGEQKYTCKGCGETRTEVLARLTDAELQISDPQLEAALREILGKPTGALIRSDTFSLTALDLSNRNITDVSDLAQFTQLTSLILNGNSISDIAPLANLTALKLLYLNNNNITDITPLSGLTTLEALSLSDNRISDISPISDLTGLTLLYINGNDISDITPVSAMTEMEYLSIWDNRISDISPLAAMHRLKWLQAPNNQITDLSPLKNTAALRELYLDDNLISDISVIANLTGLTRLWLQDNPVADWSPAAHVETVIGRP